MTMKTVTANTLAGVAAAIIDGSAIYDIFQSDSHEWVAVYEDGGVVDFLVSAGDTVANMVIAAEAAAPDDYALSVPKIFKVDGQYAIVFNDEGSTASSVDAHIGATLSALVTDIGAATLKAVIEVQGGFAAISIDND